MAKLPNRLVIEITNTDKVDELGNPVIGFESKDYAECVIEELKKIKAEIEDIRLSEENVDSSWCAGLKYVNNKIIDKHIFELKGANYEFESK